MSEWQDIASAPKDGTRILIPYPLHRGGVEIEAYEVMIVRWNGRGWVSEMAWMLHEDPAHWQPLPAPPNR